MTPGTIGPLDALDTLYALEPLHALGTLHALHALGTLGALHVLGAVLAPVGAAIFAPYVIRLRAAVGLAVFLAHVVRLYAPVGLAVRLAVFLAYVLRRRGAGGGQHGEEAKGMDFHFQARFRGWGCRL